MIPFDVRHDAGLLAGEQRAGATKAGHHLVGNEEHAVPAGEQRQFRQ